VIVRGPRGWAIRKGETRQWEMWASGADIDEMQAWCDTKHASLNLYIVVEKVVYRPACLQKAFTV
jgi:hypothetical protein